MKLIVRYGKPFVGIVLLCLVLLFGQAMCDLSLPNLMSDMVNVGIQQSGIEEGAPETLRQEGMELLLAFASEEDRQLLEENYYTIEPGSSEAQRLSEEYPMAREEAICVLREDLAGEELPEDSQAGSSAAESALGESGLASSQAGDSAGEEASQQEEPQDAKAALDSAYSRASYAMLLYLQQAGESGELEQAAAQLAQAQAPSQLPEAGLGEAASGMEGAVDEGFSQEGLDSGLSSGEEEGGQPLVPQPRAGEGVTLYDSQQPAYDGQAGASASQEEAGLSQETGEPSSWVGDGEGENPSAGQDASQQEGTDSSFDVSQGLDNVDMDQLYQLIPLLSYVPQESIQQAQEQAASSDSMLGGQVGVTLARLFYQELGVDVNALQSGYIWNKGLQMLGVALLGVAATVLVGFFSARMAATVGRRLRHDLFAKVESFSNGEFDRFSTASLITRTTNDVQQIQMLITMGVRMICYAPIMGIGGIIFAVGKSVSLSWLIAAAVVVLIGLIAVALAVALPKFKSLQKLIDRLNLVSREGLSGMMVVRAFGNEGYEERRFDKANRDLMETTRFVQRVMSGMIPAMMFVMNLLSILIVWVGGHAIAESTLQIGDMMAFIQYAMQIISAFLMIAMMFIMVPRASVSAGRILEVLDAPLAIQDPEKPEALSNPKGLVEFKDVSFRYGGAEHNVLEHISFVAKPGETTAFIGATGSGKSTLVNLLPRFYDVTEGSITIDGVDVRSLSQHRLRELIGYAPQKGMLFSGTVAENLRYGKEDADEEELKAALSTAQALGFVEGMDEGVQSPISQGGTNVSGGQRQRLSIARALTRKAPIYIFDDSFSALDFKTDAALRKALAKDTAQATVLLVAQRVSTIMHAQQIIVLDQGRMVGKGTHQELLKTCPEYREIAESQLQKEELE